MAHGTRGRWLRVATTGFGMVLCTGLVGCMNDDKPKDTKTTKLPGQGLPGTPTLPNGAGAVSKSGQPTGGYYGTSGSGIQQTGGTQFGAGTGQRINSNGLNPNNYGQPPANNYGGAMAAPGAPGTIGAPTQPYSPAPSVQPAGGSPSGYLGSGAGMSGGTSYAPPSLVDVNLPAAPLPPGAAFGGAPGKGEFAGGVPVPQPGLGPVAPPSSPAAAGPLPPPAFQ